MSSYDSSDDELTVDSSIRDTDRKKKHHRERRHEDTIIVNNYQVPQYPIPPYPCPDNLYNAEELKRINSMQQAEEYLAQDDIPRNPLGLISWGTSVFPKSRAQIEKETIETERELTYLTMNIEPLDISSKLKECETSTNAPFLINGSQVPIMDVLNQSVAKNACNPYLTTKDVLFSNMDMSPIDPPLIPGNPCANKICQSAFGPSIKGSIRCEEPFIAPIKQPNVVPVPTQPTQPTQTPTEVTIVVSTNPCQPPNLQTFDASKNKSVTFEAEVTEITVIGNKGQPNSTPYPNALIILPAGDCGQLPDGRVITVINTLNVSVPVKAPGGGFRGTTGVAVIRGNKTRSFSYTKSSGWTIN